MRYHSYIIVIALAISLTGCGESDAVKANKKAMDTNSLEISLRLAHTSESAGDFPAAERYFKQATTKDKNIASRIELAEFYKRHHGARQALAVLTEAQKMEPNNTQVMRAIANVHIDLNSPAEALKIIDGALKITGNDALLYNSKGVALDMLGRYTHARNAYSTALSLDPDDAMLFDANLGMSYIMSGYYSKAIDLLLPLARSPDSTPQIRQNLALAYGLKGDNENALKYARRDLSGKEAEENVKFYNMLAIKGGVKKPDAIINIPAIPPAAPAASEPATPQEAPPTPAEMTR